jgi:O-antigen ligase
MLRIKRSSFDGDFAFTLLLAIYLSLLPIEAILSFGSIGSVHKYIGGALIILTVYRNGQKISINNIWMLLFAGITVISSLWSLEQDTSLAYSITIMSIVVFTILMEQHRYTEQEFKLITISIIVVGLYLSLNIALGTGLSVMEVSRTTIGSFGHRVDHNNMALGLAFSDILLLVKIRNKPYNIIKFIFTIIGCMLITYAILLTGSRGGLLCFLIAAVCYLLYLLRSVHIIHRIILMLVTVMLVINIDQFLLLLPEDIANRFTIANIASNGGANRFNVWVNAFDYFKSANMFEWFFGIGYGTFPTMHSIYYGSYMAAHNDYVQILVELGAVGLICLLCMLGKEVKESIKTKDMVAFMIISLVLVGCFSMETIFKKVTWAAILISYIYRTIVTEKNKKS